MNPINQFISYSLWADSGSFNLAEIKQEVVPYIDLYISCWSLVA